MPSHFLPFQNWLELSVISEDVWAQKQVQKSKFTNKWHSSHFTTFFSSAFMLNNSNSRFIVTEFNDKNFRTYLLMTLELEKNHRWSVIIFFEEDPEWRLFTLHLKLCSYVCLFCRHLKIFFTGFLPVRIIRNQINPQRWCNFMTLRYFKFSVHVKTIK